MEPPFGFDLRIVVSFWCAREQPSNTVYLEGLWIGAVGSGVREEGGTRGKRKKRERKERGWLNCFECKVFVARVLQTLQCALCYCYCYIMRIALGALLTPHCATCSATMLHRKVTSASPWCIVTCADQKQNPHLKLISECRFKTRSPLAGSVSEPRVLWVSKFRHKEIASQEKRI